MQKTGNIATANPKGSFGKASLCEKLPRHQEMQEILFNTSPSNGLFMESLSLRAFVAKFSFRPYRD
jgi:hypothetical protein